MLDGGGPQIKVIMDQKIKNNSDILEETIMVTDEYLNNKMEEIKEKVKMLEAKMNMMLSKFSTKNTVSKDKLNVPSLVQSELIENKEINCSDTSNVTLVYRGDQMIPVHKVILSSANIVKSKNNKNLTTYCSGTPNVTLVYENEQLVSVHKVIHSCACHFCTKLTKQNWFKFTLIVKGEQQNLYRSKFDLLKEPDREKYQLRFQTRMGYLRQLFSPMPSPASPIQCQEIQEDQGSLH
jgi:hypothetical protein